MADPCRLYLLTPPSPGPDLAQRVAAALDGGDVACVQLRAKEAAEDELLAFAADLRNVCAPRGVALVLNDNAALAARAGADGVHLGQWDGTVRAARDLLGDDAIVGVTCHASRDLAITAADQGASYVAFGAFFDTATKAAPTRADADLLAWWSDFIEVPCVAIGGITAANCAPLVRAGADFLAVSSAVWDHPDGPAAAVAALNRAIADASN
ncbi:MAG: thiamine phosphate synthase [Proteobacteria bacterium]|nr:thiamine phosphate synthase [Pseudomonadota bacterium]MDA1133283.1 thiamine phosphate synthase [Pseudomonadota bacterium]